MKIHNLLCINTKPIKFNKNYQEEIVQKLRKCKIKFKIAKLNFKGQRKALKIRKEQIK